GRQTKKTDFHLERVLLAALAVKDQGRDIVVFVAYPWFGSGAADSCAGPSRQRRPGPAASPRAGRQGQRHAEARPHVGALHMQRRLKPPRETAVPPGGIVYARRKAAVRQAVRGRRQPVA